jgi:hypothetical protein
MSTPRFSCADLEVLLADYIDQTLLDRDVADLKAHLATCESCRELAADAAAAVNLIERAAVVEAPPELINRLVFDVTNGSSRQLVKPRARGFFGRLAQTIWQPRFAMGMAMTMLSIGMLLRMAGVRQWSDLNPVNVYATAEDHVTRWIDRGVKNYQSLKLVYEIQSRYQEWVAEQDKERSKTGEEKASEDGRSEQQQKEGK